MKVRHLVSSGKFFISNLFPGVTADACQLLSLQHSLSELVSLRANQASSLDAMTRSWLLHEEKISAPGFNELLARIHAQLRAAPSSDGIDPQLAGFDVSSFGLSLSFRVPEVSSSPELDSFLVSTQSHLVESRSHLDDSGSGKFHHDSFPYNYPSGWDRIGALLIKSVPRPVFSSSGIGMENSFASFRSGGKSKTLPGIQSFSMFIIPFLQCHHCRWRFGRRVLISPLWI